MSQPSDMSQQEYDDMMNRAACEALYEDEEFDDEDPEHVCPYCHGTGVFWDGPEECDHCDGMGYWWWL